MTRLRRLILPVALLGLGLASAALPGRAQQTGAARFAFADTTLLRDTLGLSFEGLFEVSDSLQITPDSLRALSIRYVIPLERMVFLADSLRMPVDSVGVVMERERFNPLALRAEDITTFGYNSTFTIGRRSKTWSNSYDYNMARGPIFVRNVTRISITRTTDGSLTDRYESRSSNTETGWRLSPNLSFGARANLQRTDNFKPGSIYNSSIATNQFQFSARSREEPLPGLISELSFFGGPFNEPNSTPEKRGFEGLMNGRLGFTSGRWLSHDLNVQASSRNGRGRLLGRPWLDTRDLSGNLQGTLNLFLSGPVGARVAYGLRGDHLERPDTLTQTSGGSPAVADAINENPSGSKSLELGTRLRDKSGNYLNVTQRFSDTQGLIAISRGGRFVNDRTTTADENFSMNGRYELMGVTIDARFANGYPSSENPRRGTVNVQRAGLADTTITVDYRERQISHNRSFSTTLSTNLSPRLVLVATGNVSLNSFRYAITDSAYREQTGTARVAPTDPRDDYRQAYQIEVLYNRSVRMNTAIALQVSLNRNLNLLASRSSSNRDDHVYRAEWRWTYRMMRGLTATQRNQVIATYTRNTFNADRNRLDMDYSTITTLNAVITPRFSLDLTHNARYQPSGDYLQQEDQLEYFSRSDEIRNYTLSGRVSYRPVPALSVTIQPTYQSSARDGTVGGDISPVSRRKSLNFTGSANLNVPIGSKARLTGNIGRTFLSSGSTAFPSGIPRVDPVFEEDFWNGSLQLSWSL